MAKTLFRVYVLISLLAIAILFLNLRKNTSSGIQIAMPLNSFFNQAGVSNYKVYISVKSGGGNIFYYIYTYSFITKKDSVHIKRCFQEQLSSEGFFLDDGNNQFARLNGIKIDLYDTGFESDEGSEWRIELIDTRYSVSDGNGNVK